jgi:hypothetical protein
MRIFLCGGAYSAATIACARSKSFTIIHNPEVGPPALDSRSIACSPALSSHQQRPLKRGGPMAGPESPDRGNVSPEWGAKYGQLAPYSEEASFFVWFNAE